MGCCSSLPDRDEGGESNSRSNNNRNQTTETTTTHIKKPEVTITRPSSSLHSVNAEKSVTDGGVIAAVVGASSHNSSSSASPPLQAQQHTTTTATTTWPIYVRLSNNGQDITIQVPIEPPYLTVGGLRKELLPHLNNSSSTTRVKLIYLGRILPDQHVIVPTQTADDDGVPLPTPKNRAIHIQKEGVIQAMVTKAV